MACHVTASEALQVEQTLGQAFRGVAVGTATVGQGFRAASLQLLQTAQLRVREHVSDVGITEEDTHRDIQRLGQTLST